jgi:threonine synthase
LEQTLDVGRIWLKDDGRLPSSSFKDRASSMVIARALEMGVRDIVTASTGNAAAALATLCAGTGIQAHIFVPTGTPEGKLAGILIHGARVYAVRGSYDDAVALSNEAAQKFGWYNRNTGTNPYTREGKKTAAYEIAEQLAVAGPRGEDRVNFLHPSSLSAQPFSAPDVVIVPVGDGNILSGLHKGFKDLLALGWIDHMPRFIGVTATLAPALYRAWQSGTERIERVPSATIASGISVDVPNDGIMALRAIRETGGTLIEATDDEMLAGMATLAQQAAVFVEPACAAAYVGLSKARQRGEITSTDEVVLQLTGSGLKDTQSVLRAVAQPQLIANLRDIRT